MSTGQAILFGIMTALLPSLLFLALVLRKVRAS